MTKQECIENLSAQGFTNLYVCRCAPNMELGSRPKDKHTVYSVLNGSLRIISKLSPTIIDRDGEVTFSPESEEKITCGEYGCEFIVGFR